MIQNASKSNLPNVTVKQRRQNVIMQVYDEPKAQERPQQQNRVIQNHLMMMFQQLIMKEARAALRRESLKQFSNPINVEIEITTLQTPNQLQLENVLKAIFDGLNRQVIYDDSIINNAQIWLKKGNKRYPKTVIEVNIEDSLSKESISFSCQHTWIEKVDAVPYDVGGKMTFSTQAVTDQQIIEQTLHSTINKTSISGQYDICHMLFCTNDDTKDVDNMFLSYIHVIRDMGLLDGSKNIGIGMYKRHAEQGNEKTIINLLSN
ncbi:RusA family crossover junction endodeoxyribonuclease [Oceanobacillus kimchii]|uniref:RusA family crossover junction endodeoxyribonuclease n=1 Tax=Oceanobacillus kimchii TaxID=746691 RepID=UPI0021A902DE|nr:RusA family crossover junction endodeoxyribonuclease [Oceanobacillus kimchii]MCT1577063.1 RusA family crossover junction endodeoxyribonuclease [Oceanobacillus kimchii]MCT2135133.1 RusA family crossover junction endodeoxyribonuclease [Oceanobacillus kimchii]